MTLTIRFIKQTLLLILFALISIPFYAGSYLDKLDFRYLQTRDGLSNSQINYIFKDSKGFYWFATQAGLDRFDGFRFKNYFFDSNDNTSIPNNSIHDIQEDATGDLWIRTGTGYCIYNYQMEKFDRDPGNWLQTIGIKGTPYRVFIDSKKNMWFIIYGKGMYFFDVKTQKVKLFPSSNTKKNSIPLGDVHRITETNNTVVLTYNDGTLCRVDGEHNKVLWVNKACYEPDNKDYFTYVDRNSNYWVASDKKNSIYSSATHKWYHSVGDMLRSMGVKTDLGDFHVKDIREDFDGNLWIASNHEGLYVVDLAKHTVFHYMNSDSKNSLPDNTIEQIYFDEYNKSVWLGSYKNGLAFYSPSASRFQTISTGDICTIVEDQIGNYWLGTNDSGIICYNPITGMSKRYTMAETGLGSDVVISSCRAKDGSLYFGTYDGGMTRYHNGQWTAYKGDGKPGGLANKNVWSIVEDNLGEIVVGTLGSGIQILDPKTNLFVTYNQANSGLGSDYVNSVTITPEGNILIATSVNYSIMDTKTRKVENYSKTKDGKPFFSPTVNHAIMDSRGIIWTATAAGIAMYDPSNGQHELINEINGTRGAVGCGVLEDANHTMWLVSDHFVSHLILKKGEGDKWEFQVLNYNSLDGLQERQFNYRSIFLDHKGNIVLGGQDGINVISPNSLKVRRMDAKVLFSGIVLFDHPLTANEEYNGRVILEEALNQCRRIVLEHDENAFTVQLASNEVSVPARCRFLYRMEGVRDRWMMTAENQPNVTFTNLAFGHYTLQVKVVNADGSISEDIGELEIVVNPPFYLSMWANFVYLAIIIIIYYLIRRRAKEKAKAKFEREKMAEDLQKNHELNELKLNFFTNISHELRTPLTLIISPIKEMINTEDNESKKRKLQLIYRNADRLLTLVNQILDFRKLESNKETLNTINGDIIDFVKNVCSSFKQLANSKITLTFYSADSSLMMLFDSDKVSKIVTNLLSNAYKFTPDGGKIDVEMHVVSKKMLNLPEDMIEISVSDTGCGISDEDKKRIFDRFYQINGTEMKPHGGSGIGLNLVKEFVDLHEGNIRVVDNPVGGTRFIIDLPIRKPAEEIEERNPVTLVKEQAEEKKEEKISLDKPTILLVDDSEDFREFMVSVLADKYNVVEAENGKVALQKVLDFRPNIILSDVMMPVMDGNEFCKTVKGNPDTAMIPFVMLTARLTQEQKIEGLESGSDDYITKPFSLDLLILRIENLIKWSSAHKHNLHNLDEDNNLQLDESGQEKDEENIPIEEAAEEQVHVTEADRKLLAEVDKLINDNMDDADLNVEGMSQKLGMSRVQLYKRMVPVTGVTPSEYIRAKRIERAEWYLRQGEHTVSEIAYMVGFNNPRYFSKYFQDAYGMTPSQYKKKHNG